MVTRHPHTQARRHGRPHAGGRAPRERGSADAADRIYGQHTVAAWIEAQPARLRTLFFDADGGDPVRRIVARARAAGVAVQALPGDAIAERAGGRRHQGLVADCSPFPYAEVEAVLAPRPRLLVVVDQLHDPHNLGAILRSAEAVGAGGLIAPKDNCVGVTAVAEAAAAGTSAWLPVARVTNLARALTRLKEAGYWIVGLSAAAGSDIFAFDAPEHVALLVGGEAGLRPLVARQVDFELAIPMRGHAESLNASVAAAVALYALARPRAGQS